MTDPTTIDAAVEQVVRHGGEPQALETSVRELAGLLGYELVAKADDPAAMLVHAKFGGHHEQHGGRDEYVTPCGTVGAANLTSLWSCISCDGCVKALINGPDPKPRDGEHGTCARCGQSIQCVRDPYGIWWTHDTTAPADGHDAEIGGPA